MGEAKSAEQQQYVALQHVRKLILKACLHQGRLALRADRPPLAFRGRHKIRRAIADPELVAQACNFVLVTTARAADP